MNRNNARGRAAPLRGKAQTNPMPNNPRPGLQAFNQVRPGNNGRSMLGALGALNDLIEDYRTINGPSNSDTPVQIMNKLDSAVITNDSSVIIEYCRFHKGIIANLINVPGNNSILHRAVKQNKAESVRTLLECGVNPNLKNNKNRAPLHKAYNSPESIQALIEFGAVINMQDNSGATPLHRAICKGNDKVASLLISLGADITIKDFVGKAATDYCKTEKQSKVFQSQFIWKKNKNYVYLYHYSIMYKRLPEGVFSEILNYV